MKEEIKNYFRSDRSYGGGVALVMKHSPKQGLKRQLNVQHESDYMMGIVHEELRQMAGLNHHEMNYLLSGTIAKEQSPALQPTGNKTPAAGKGKKTGSKKTGSVKAAKEPKGSAPKKESRKK